MAKKNKKSKKDYKQEKFEFEETVEKEEQKESKEEIVEETETIEEVEEETELEETEEESEDETDDDDSEDDEDEEETEEESDDDDEDEDSDEEDEEDDEDSDEDEDANESKVSVKRETNPVKDTDGSKVRIIISIIAGVLLVLLVGLLIYFGSKNNKTSISNSSTSTAERNVSTQALKDFYKQFDSKELNVIFFASSTCGYCTLEKPILKQISSDYKFDYYEIDASQLTNVEKGEMIKALGIQGATPTTVIVKEGKVVATNQGYLDGTPYTKFFASNGVIAEDAVYKPESKITSISYKEFKSKAKEDKNNLFIIDQSACQECSTARSLLSKLADKNKFNVYNLSANNLSKDELQDFIEKDLKDLGFSDKEYKNNKQVNIPLVLITKDNKIKDYLISKTNESDYKKVLEKYKFIK